MQRKSPLRAGQPTLRNTRTLTENNKKASADGSETDESGNYQHGSDAIDSGREDDSSYVILAFINSDEEDANEWAKCHTLGEPYLKDRKLISLSFDLCFFVLFLINSSL